MKNLLILLFLILIVSIKLLHKNNENFKSSSSAISTDNIPFIPNPLIKEKSKNLDSEFSDETKPKYYKKNPEVKFRPTICDIKKSELKKGLPPDWSCYLDENGNGESYLYNMYLGEKKYIYHIDNNLKKLFNQKYKPHLEKSEYKSILDAILKKLEDKIKSENKNKNSLMYHILFDTNLMHRILHMYKEYDLSLNNSNDVNNHVNLKTLLLKSKSNSIKDIPKYTLVKLIMDNLYKTRTEAETILSIDSDPIIASLKLLNDDTKCFSDFLSDHENKQISMRTNNNYDSIYKSTLGKQYNIIMDDYV